MAFDWQSAAAITLTALAACHLGCRAWRAITRPQWNMCGSCVCRSTGTTGRTAAALPAVPAERLCQAAPRTGVSR